MAQGRLFPTSRSERRCVRCGLTKPASEFAWREKTKGKRFAHCRACQAVYYRKHYEANADVYRSRAAVRRRGVFQRNSQLLLEFLEGKQCVDCGEADVVVLDFDHLIDKCFDISRAVRHRKWLRIEEEIRKCDIVCGNCHRLRTSRRQGSMRYRLTRGEDSQ